MDINSYIINLKKCSEGQPPAQAGPYIHRVFYNLEAVTIELANFEHKNQTKPFTVSNLFQYSGKPSFRITTLTEPLGIAAAEALGEGESFRIKSVNYSIDSINMDFQTSHEDLYKQYFVTPGSSDQIRNLKTCFVSPTTFRHKDGNHPLPVPSKVWHSWLASWQSFAPEDIGSEFLEVKNFLDWVEEYIFPSKLRIISELVDLGEMGKLFGFTGETTFKITGDESHVHRIARMLWAYSTFCGTGQKTTMGLGQTRSGASKCSVTLGS